MKSDSATIRIELWGSLIGAATWDEERRLAVFQYDPSFLGSGVELSPIRMKLRREPYDFPGLSSETFRGLPGLLAESLPDRYGTAVADRWYAATGRIPEDVHALRRLQTIGRSGMGALEFQPEELAPSPPRGGFDIETAYVLAAEVFEDATASAPRARDDAARITAEMLRPGMLAGGAKPKAVLLWKEGEGFSINEDDVGRGFQHWLIKFDGARAPRESGASSTEGRYGVIEYAYYKMAAAAGVDMAPSRLETIAGRRHFMTRRFDRTPAGGKILMQSLGAIAHYDYNRPGAYSYEQCLQIMRRLDLPAEDFEQQALRAFFNVVARNQDDHVKNIAFLMDRRGRWRLSPAFDMTFSFNPRSVWTGAHQMSLNDKRDRFERQDLVDFALKAGVKTGRANGLLDQVIDAVRAWGRFAEEAGLPAPRADAIASTFRTGSLAR